MKNPDNKEETLKNAYRTIEGLSSLSKEFNTILTFNKMSSEPNTRSKNLILTPENNQEIFKIIYNEKHRDNNKILNSDDYLLWQSGQRDLSYHCPVASTSVVVNENGNIIGSCDHYGPFDLGNVKETFYLILFHLRNTKDL